MQRTAEFSIPEYNLMHGILVSLTYHPGKQIHSSINILYGLLFSHPPKISEVAFCLLGKVINKFPSLAVIEVSVLAMLCTQTYF